MAEIDAEQRHELELMIRELETENATLQVRTIYTFKSGIFKLADRMRSMRTNGASKNRVVFVCLCFCLTFAI